ncbi:hypothetical protein LIA77_10560 [Sarocladium implicatum]|nr:hypothetical protein LIA77_10560 [Sarocladium implicatum]
MARVPTSTAVAEPITNNGLRFMNSAWNDTIANGELYNLNWDRSLHGIDSSLGVYQISYLEDGIIAYKLAVDITQHADDRIARWTPRDLDDGLYVFWLQTIGEDPERWAISPPWEPSEPRPHDLKWATPIGIPIAVMMGIYFISLVTCLLYRRKKKARSRRAEIRESERRAMLADQRRRRQQEDESEDPLTGDRHPSVSSLDTASTSVEEDVAKPECVAKQARAGGLHIQNRFPMSVKEDDPHSQNLFVQSVRADVPHSQNLFVQSVRADVPHSPNLFVQSVKADAPHSPSPFTKSVKTDGPRIRISSTKSAKEDALRIRISSKSAKVDFPRIRICSAKSAKAGVPHIPNCSSR